MLWRMLTTWVLLGMATCFSACWAAPRAERPNILVILTDDQRWDALGVVQKELGQRALFPWFQTPNLDRLAREGVRFSNTFVTTSLCSPSRASFLSGRMARNHRVQNNFTEYPNALPGYPRRLHEAGYETAYIGKWHMGENNDEQRPGFDFWMSHRGQGNYFDNEFNVNGTRRRFPGYYTTVVTEAAVDWIRQPHPKPWLMVLGQKAPHGGPIQPEPRFAQALDAFPIRKPVNYDNHAVADGKPAWLSESLKTWHGSQGPLYGLKEHERLVRAYLATLLSIDESVGRVYAALRASGQLDRTVIVFTSDNGFVLGEHGRVDKRTAYEDSIRIPLIIRHPGLGRPVTTVSNLALNLDLAPTLVDFAGAPALRGIQGRSLKPLMQGHQPRWRESFVYEYNYEEQFPYTPNVRALRTDRWKLIRYPHGDGSADRFTAELYDLANDPDELRNLIQDPAAAPVRRRLEKDLTRISRESGPDRMPVYGGIVNVLPKY